MISQADGARLMAAHQAAVHTAVACADEAAKENSTHKARQRLIAADKAAEERFAALVATLTDSEGL